MELVEQVSAECELWKVGRTKVVIRATPSRSGRILASKGPGEVFATLASESSAAWVQLAPAELAAMRVSSEAAYCCVDGASVGKPQLGRLIERARHPSARWSYASSLARVAEAGATWRDDRRTHLVFRPAVSTSSRRLPWLRAWCADDEARGETAALCRLAFSAKAEEVEVPGGPASPARVWACAFVSGGLSARRLQDCVERFGAYHLRLGCERVVVFLDCPEGREVSSENVPGLVLQACYEADWWVAEARFNRLHLAAADPLRGREARQVIRRAEAGDPAARRAVALDRLERSTDLDWLLCLDIHDALHFPKSSERADCRHFFSRVDDAREVDLCVLDAVAPSVYKVHPDLLVDDDDDDDDDDESWRARPNSTTQPRWRELVAMPVFTRRLAVLPCLKDVGDDDFFCALAHAPRSSRVAKRVTSTEEDETLLKCRSLFAPVVLSRRHLLPEREWLKSLARDDVLNRAVERLDDPTALYRALFADDFSELAHAAQFGLVVAIPLDDDDDDREYARDLDDDDHGDDDRVDSPVARAEPSRALVRCEPAVTPRREEEEEPGPRYLFDRLDKVADAAPTVPASFSAFVGGRNTPLGWPTKKEHTNIAAWLSERDEGDDDDEEEDPYDDRRVCATKRQSTPASARSSSSSFAQFVRSRRRV